MKRWIFLLALCNSASLLVAQSFSSGSGGGGQASGSSSAGRQGAQTAPAVGAPVQSSPAQGGIGANRPVAAGTLDSGVTAPSQVGVEASAQGATAANVTGAAGATDDTTPQPRAASGVEPLRAVLAPPLNSLPPPVRNDIQSQIVDPAGASDSTTQGAGTGTAFGVGQTRTGAGQAVGDEAFTQQFQSLTAGQGTTQVAFPQENAVVTIISQDGNLTLQGTVGSEQQRANLEQAIREISAGGFIDNQIRIIEPSSGTVE